MFLQSDWFLIYLFFVLHMYIYMSQHIKRDQLSQKIKTDFLLFPKWLFFQLNFGAKFFEIGHCVLEIWQFYWGCHDRLVKCWFWEKGSYGNLYKVLLFWHFRGQFLHENTAFAPNPSSTLKIKTSIIVLKIPKYAKSQNQL